MAADASGRVGATPEGIKGAPDWLPPRSRLFDRVEAAFLDTARLAGYERIRVPAFEHTEVFARAVGESTDIVQKEMYTFRDKGGRSLTLRPEATAGVVRAALEAGVARSGGLPWKAVLAGEMFRYEQPQRGRQRVFTQVNVEALGSDDPLLDAEQVILAWEALLRAGVAAADVELRLGNLGDRSDRAAYLERLNGYLDTVEDRLAPEVRERRHLNPLRAFDSKAPGMGAAMAAAPALGDHLNADAVEHVAAVRRVLDAEAVPYTFDPRLVRGLDYYTRTTFEVHHMRLGAQGAIGGGGRYDGLAEDLGWPERFPGVGWALGVDRTVLALELAAEAGAAAATTRAAASGASDREAGSAATPASSPSGTAVAAAEPPPGRVAAFVVPTGPETAQAALTLATTLRRAGVAADLGFDGRRARAQFKAADRAGARWALVLGPDELSREVVTVKDLASGEQTEVTRDDLLTALTAPA